MATRIAGEKYLGGELRLPLSGDGNVVLYFWPCRILQNKVGGPTIGIDVGDEEVIRFDCHGEPGHWHGMYGGKGGAYDQVGAAGSRQDFPRGLNDIPRQVHWSTFMVRNELQGLLEEAGREKAAQAIHPELVRHAVAAIQACVSTTSYYLREGAVEQGLIKEEVSAR